MRRSRALTLAACVGLALHLALAPGLTAQATASTFLPQDHWVHDAARRLVLQGAVEPIAVTGRRTLTRAEAVLLLETAGSTALLDRFLAEFAASTPDHEPGPRADASAVAGVDQHTGGLRTGTGYGIEGIPSEPPVPGPDYRSVLAQARLYAGWGERIAGELAAGYTARDWRVESGHAVGVAGPVLLWAGRRPMGFGPGTGGGVVLGDWARLDGAGIQLAAPHRPGGVFRVLGAIHVETHLGRKGTTGGVRNPWFWTSRAAVQPHPRLVLGINRGAIFGGEGNVASSFQDLLYVIIGKHGASGSAFENQLASFDLYLRPALPIATELYVEWGLEDSAGAIYDVPGVLWGVAVLDPPGLSDVRLGVERTTFAGSCCGNPIWYRHMFLAAGWTEDGVPLGHPLGGHGSEWLLHASRGFIEERVQLRAELGTRDRQGENLYAPDRTGSSQFGSLDGRYRTGGVEVGVEVRAEGGEGWEERRVVVSAGWTF